jgi:hypothetical protein
MREQVNRSNQNWFPAPGDHVEVRRNGSTLRLGTVEIVMHDDSGFWLAADGVEPRVFVHIDDNEKIILSP